MLKIGITGGIGSGKSTVCRIFSQMGIPIYSADNRAKQLMNENQTLITAIKQLFGEEAYHEAKLNRAYISERAFSNPALLEQLNALVHPAVAKDFLDWAIQQKTPYVVKEAALMYESGSFRDLDYVITVSAPKELRILRTMQRDGMSREQVLARMKRQWSEKQRNEAADFIIKNDGNHALIPQVLELHRKFLFISLG